MSDQMRRRFQLRYDPLQVFADSKTPAGLYARQKWLQEGKMHNWIHDFKEAVKALRMDQLSDGSWGRSKIKTIQGLFSLHLTVREPDDAIRKGIDWLLCSDSLEQPPVTPRMGANMICNQDEDKIEDSSFHGLPFTNGCMNHLGICAALFLANCFGLGEEERITGLYDAIAREIEARDGHWYNIDCTNNALRAFATHSRYARSKSTAMMVNYLGQRQLAVGQVGGQGAILSHLQCPCPPELGKGKTSVHESRGKCSEDSEQRWELGEVTERVEYFSCCARVEQVECILGSDLSHLMRYRRKFHSTPEHFKIYLLFYEGFM